jgi:hypothetical protein
VSNNQDQAEVLVLTIDETQRMVWTLRPHSTIISADDLAFFMRAIDKARHTGRAELMIVIKRP